MAALGMTPGEAHRLEASPSTRLWSDSVFSLWAGFVIRDQRWPDREAQLLLWGSPTTAAWGARQRVGERRGFLGGGDLEQPPLLDCQDPQSLSSAASVGQYRLIHTLPVKPSFEVSSPGVPGMTSAVSCLVIFCMVTLLSLGIGHQCVSFPRRPAGSSSSREKPGHSPWPQ